MGGSEAARRRERLCERGPSGREGLVGGGMASGTERRGRGAEGEARRGRSASGSRGRGSESRGNVAVAADGSREVVAEGAMQRRGQRVRWWQTAAWRWG